MKRTVLLNVYEKSVEVMDVKGELEDFYRNIECSCIAITRRKIGDRWYDLVVDDEGLLESFPTISAFDSRMRPVLVGNIMFFNVCEDGELVGLSDDDVNYIKSYIKEIVTLYNGITPYPVITNCDYQ